MPYLAPTNRDDAFRFLQSHSPKIVAGCTDYFPALAQGQVDEDLLDITRLEGMRGISRTPQGWRIGAATTWTDIVRAELPPAFDALKAAAREVGSVQIQNQATIAGNLCNASPAADGVPPLLVLDAQVEVASMSGPRVVPLTEFIIGVRQVDLRAGEFVSAILIPEVCDMTQSVFKKLGSRTHLVISIAMVAVAARVDAGKLAEVKIAVGSCSPVARRLHRLEAMLLGLSAHDVSQADFTTLEELSPISDVRGTAEYRRGAVAELCRRAVLDELGRA